MNVVEKTVDLHRNGGLNCSQAILTAFGEKYGIDSETARVLGRPWGGGVGHMAGACGYLNGAVLVLAKAMDNGDEGKARVESAKAVRELFHRFEERRGSTLCKDLLGADMSTDEGKKRVAEEKLPAKFCFSDDGVGRDVAEILEELL